MLFNLKHTRFSFLLNLFILFVVLSASGSFQIKRYLTKVVQSQITLTVAGKGTIKYIHSINPDEVYVNKKLQEKCKKSCSLISKTNTVILKFNTQITTCEKMFYGIKNITKIDLSKFDFSKVTNMAHMFHGCTNLATIQFGDINTKALLNMQHLFCNCAKLKTIDLSKFVTTKVTDLQFMFYQCTSLVSLDLSNFNTKKVEFMTQMFAGCTSITKITLKFAGTSVKNMTRMFFQCKKLASVDLSSLGTSAVVDMNRMFYNCKSLKTINLSEFQASKVVNMNHLFCYCWVLEEIKMTKLKVSNVKRINHMFYECYKLKEIDLSGFDTSNTLRMDYMFHKCSELTRMNLTTFKTTNVTNMEYMFCGCEKLQYLDLANFDISKVTTIKYMFYNCKSLIYLNLYNFVYHTPLALSKLFTSVPTDLKYCINDTLTISKLLNKQRLKYLNCCDTCFNDNTSIDMQKRQCIQEPKKNNNNKYCFPLITKEIIFDTNNNEESDVNKEEENENDNEEEENKDNNNKCKEFSSNKTACYNNIPEGFYFDDSDGSYKNCYKNCKKCEGPGNENNNNCTECKFDFIFLNDSRFLMNCYKNCNYYFYYQELSNEYLCTETNECPNEFDKLIKEKNECVDECKNDNIFKYDYNNTCYEKCPNETFHKDGDYLCIPLEEYNTNDLYEIKIAEKDDKIMDIQDDLQNGNLDDVITNISESKEDFMKKDDDMLLQITTSENQKNNSNSNVSSLDLGECEDILRDVYNISKEYPLIILKMDYYSPDSLIPKIGYEVYHPLNKSKLDLIYCKDILIKLNIPVSIDENNLFKYDPNSDYYNDNCFSYTTEDGTDIILKDRQKEFSDNKLSLCEDNCNYIGYDAKTKQSSCNCSSKNKIDLVSEIVDNENILSKNIISNDTSGSSSIVSLKCTKALFTKDGLKNNISSYVLIIIIVYFTICILLYIKCGYPLLNNDIDEILNWQKNKTKQSRGDIGNILKRKRKNKKRIKNKEADNFPPKKYNTKIANSINIKRSNTINKNIINSKVIKNPFNSLNTKVNDNNNINSIINTDSKNKKIEYTDVELNSLDYKCALQYDRRTYCQYYISLLRKKHPITFAFCPIKDYNSLIIKSSLFSLSFAIYYAINFVLFNEEDIHKLYEKGGKYDIMYFLQKILISFGISYIANVILIYIFVTERNLMEIKNQPTLEAASNIVEKVKKNIIIKYTLYFISGIIFLVFFWFLLSSFGAVYQNTQIIIFKNTLISFGISLFYPFIINIFTCLFRIVAINSKDKNMECMYTLSKIMQII